MQPEKKELIVFKLPWFITILVWVLLAACGEQPGSRRGPLEAATPTPLATQAVTMLSPVAVMVITPTATAIPATPTSTAGPRRTSTASPTPSAPAPTGNPSPDPGRLLVPVLLYHHVSDAGKTRYFVPVAQFKAQMKLLADEGYQSISISQLAGALRDGSDLPEKPVVLTFDDGYEDIYENAFPILSQYHFTGVAYIITGTLGTKLSYGYMQAPELKELAAAGWEIGSHSISHTDLKTSKLGMGTELRQSREDLEALLGVPVHSFSYPFGSATAWVQGQVKNYGYNSAVGLGITVTHTRQQLYYLSRREVYHSLTLKDFQDLLTPGKVEQMELALPSATPETAP
jgi:hypothetical protein